jgi:hypothetical protein
MEPMKEPIMSISLRKIAFTVAATALAVVGLATVSPGAAQAASGPTVRLAPASNPFLFLDVAGSSTAPGAAIIQWYYNGGSNQVWRLSPSGTNLQIVNRWSGQCITTDGIAGDLLFQAPCNGSASQQWASSISAGNLIGYTIMNPASGLYMEIYGASGAQGAAVDAWYYNGGSNQFFVASNT